MAHVIKVALSCALTAGGSAQAGESIAGRDAREQVLARELRRLEQPGPERRTGGAASVAAQERNLQSLDLPRAETNDYRRRLRSIDRRRDMRAVQPRPATRNPQPLF